MTSNEHVFIFYEGVKAEIAWRSQQVGALLEPAKISLTSSRVPAGLLLAGKSQELLYETQNDVTTG